MCHHHPFSYDYFVSFQGDNSRQQMPQIGCTVSQVNASACVGGRPTVKYTLTNERSYEDENLYGGGEVPVGLVFDESLVLIQSCHLVAAVPHRWAGGVEQVGRCEIRCTIPDRRSPAPNFHVHSQSCWMCISPHVLETWRDYEPRRATTAHPPITAIGSALPKEVMPHAFLPKTSFMSGGSI